MQKFLYEYVLNVAVTGVLMGVMESLLPEGKLRAAARLALSLVMLTAMAAPLAKLSGAEFTLEAAPTLAQPATKRTSYEEIVQGVMRRQLSPDNAKEE